jgi:hypothetical protein
MALRFLRRWFRDVLDSTLARRELKARPRLEELEDRILLSTLVVNNPLDMAVANELSLRQAVALANTDASAGQSDTITFDPSLGSSTISLTQGPLELSGAGTGTITIDGSAPSTPVTIDGSQNTGRLFQVDSGVQVVIQNLNLNNGSTTSDGGAILNAGTLTVANVNFTGNSASSGGAIVNQGTLTLSNVVLANNSADGTNNLGGALDNTGTATVMDSTLTSDTAQSGGAIANAGTLSVSNSTFASNAASGSGGAIDSLSGSVAVTGGFFTGNSADSGSAIDNKGILTVTAATISDNTAQVGAGGAIHNDGGTVTLSATTVSGNGGGGLANTAGALTLTQVTVSGNSGGAITNGATLTLQNTTVSANSGVNAIQNGGSLTLQNSIVAGNANSGTTGDIGGTITTDDGYNLLGTADNNTTTNPDPGPHDVFSDTPGMATLGNYGGPTQTMALLIGSVAIGGGNAGAANLPGTDQRGLPRVVNGSLDIGAFQTQAPALAFLTLGQTFAAGQMATITVELQDLDGNPALAGAGGVTVTLASSSNGGSFFNALGMALSGQTITIPAGSSSATFEYVDTQPGAPTLTVSASGFGAATQQENVLPAPLSNLPFTDIVVGRVLSAYFTSDVQNNQETITFTVYDESSDALSGVLLTDTLEPGVTLVSASQQPDQNGQQLAWSLGTIEGNYWTSASMTVSLANGNLLQLDTGARAYATLNAGLISNATPAANLNQGSVDPNLLASTPDANTTDPYIQEEAAALNYNAQNIFNFLHDDIGYNAYMGSLRGARGTLWSSAGNALDVASLGVALMRASGIPAQYVSGSLSQSQAQQLILSMFPASYMTVGYIPAGTQLSDPADDPQLLSETESHYWFQFDAGQGMQDADPLMAGATIGQVFTAASGTFTEVPANLRATTEIQLTAEIYSQASAALAGSGLSDTVVLDQTFNDVDLVGRPLTIGNFVSASGLGAVFTSETFTYAPYVDLGDEAYPEPNQDELIPGTNYQETYTNFPLGNQVLTGLFLNVTFSGPCQVASRRRRRYKRPSLIASASPPDRPEPRSH